MRKDLTRTRTCKRVCWQRGVTNYDALQWLMFVMHDQDSMHWEWKLRNPNFRKIARMTTQKLRSTSPVNWNELEGLQLQGCHDAAMASSRFWHCDSFIFHTTRPLNSSLVRDCNESRREPQKEILDFGLGKKQGAKTRPASPGSKFI